MMLIKVHLDCKTKILQSWLLWLAGVNVEIESDSHRSVIGDAVGCSPNGVEKDLVNFILEQGKHKEFAVFIKCTKDQHFDKNLISRIIASVLEKSVSIVEPAQQLTGE